jgi:hypothetical protein
MTESVPPADIDFALANALAVAATVVTGPPMTTTRDFVGVFASQLAVHWQALRAAHADADAEAESATEQTTLGGERR